MPSLDLRRNVVVVSHRRSGTHLAIDTIRNNFPPYAASHLSIDSLNRRWAHDDLHIGQFESELAKAPHVIKTHAHGTLHDYFDESAQALVHKLLDQAPVVYVHRDGRDVMVSLWHYARHHLDEASAMSFSEFLRARVGFDRETYDANLTPPQYWAHHVSSWLRRPSHRVSFESLLQDASGTIKRLAQLLDLPVPDRPRSVGMSPHLGVPQWSRAVNRVRRAYMKQVRGVDVTSVAFRAGRIGDHRAVFTEGDRSYFDAVAGDAMRCLGYE